MGASTQKQVSIRSDEAADIVSRLARKRGHSVKQIVTDALRREEALEDTSAHGMNPDQLEDYLYLRGLSKKYKSLVVPGSTSNHDDLYDENGLPK